MGAQTFIRIAAVALGLSTLSFAAGVAGDLSIIDPPRTGQRVVLRIPPELATDTARAAPLPPLISTAAAAGRVAAVVARIDSALPAISAKPPARLEVQLARMVPKSAQMAAFAQDERKAA